MRRVAVITDIHANLPALVAGLQAINAIGVDAVYCGGDLVGYGPHPIGVCRLIEERRIPTIYGNYDYAIGRDLEDCGCAYVTQHDRELGQQSVAWTLAHTDQHSKDFMRGLPFDLRFRLGEQRVRLVHGSPRKVNEYLFEDKPARTISAINSPNLRFLLDTGNPFAVCEDPVDAARTAAPYTVLMHVKDVRVVPWTPLSLGYFACMYACPLGEGNVDLDAIIDIMARHAPDRASLILALEIRPVPPYLDEDHWMEEGIEFMNRRFAQHLTAPPPQR